MAIVRLKDAVINVNDYNCFGIDIVGDGYYLLGYPWGKNPSPVNLLGPLTEKEVQTMLDMALGDTANSSNTGGEMEDLTCVVRLIDDTELEFDSNVTWDLNGNALSLFCDDKGAQFLVAQFPRESVVGVWRRLFEERQE